MNHQDDDLTEHERRIGDTDLLITACFIVLGFVGTIAGIILALTHR